MPTTAEIRRASSAWSAPGTCTGGSRRTPRCSGRRSRSVTIRTNGRRPPQRRTESSRSTRARQLVALAPEAQPVAPRPAAVLEAALRPGVGEQVVERAADRHDERPRAALGTAAAEQVLARGGGDDRVADEPVASPPRPRHAPAHRVGAERRRGRRRAALLATRSSSSAAQGGGVDGPRAEAGGRRRRRPAPGRAGRGRARVGGRARRGRDAAGPAHAAPGEVEPAQQLELLGAGQRATGRLVAGAGVGPRPATASYRRRGGGRPSPSTRRRRVAWRSRGRSPVAQPTARRRGAGRPTVSVGGAAGGLLGHHGQRVEGGAELELGAHPVRVASTSRPRPGRRGRRSSTSPTTSTPLPLIHSIQTLGLLLGEVEAVGRQPDRDRLAGDQHLLGEQLADEGVVGRVAPHAAARGAG